jgi:hypothetical protein
MRATHDDAAWASIRSSAGLTSMEKLGMGLLLVLGHHHGGGAVAADGVTFRPFLAAQMFW